MDADEINRQLDALWERVHKGAESLPPAIGGEDPGPAAAASVAAASSQFAESAAMETVRMLKRQHRETELYYRELLSAREREVEDLKGRLRELEGRAEALRREISDREQESMAVTLQAQVWAEDQTKAIANLKEAHRQEVAALQAAAAEVREKLRAEAAARNKLAAEWKRKEEDFVARIQELEELPNKLRADLKRREAELEKASRELDKLRKESSAASSDLQAAVTKTTEELLRERASRKEIEEARAKLESELNLLKDAHERMKTAWAEERAQWSELWERERSTWETQRQEMRQWEEDLRKQREEWLESLGRSTSGLGAGPGLRPPTQWGKGLSMPAPGAAPLPANVLRDVRWTKVVKFGGVALALACVIGGGIYAYRKYSRNVWLALEASERVPVHKPTALAWDGARLFVGAWEGKLFAFDPASLNAPAWQAVPKGLGPYRPTGLSIADGALWTLDAAQVRVLKQDPRNPSKVFWRTGDGSFPTAIAHDGRRLWIYEGNDKHLYRYRADPRLGPEESFELAPGLVATSMQWSGKDLWLYDSLSAELWRFRLEGGKFVMKTRARLEGAPAAVVATETHLWTIAAEGDKALLKRFKRKYP